MIQAKAHRDWMRQRIRVLVRDPEVGLIYGNMDVFDESELPAGNELPPNAWVIDLPERFFPQILAALNEIESGEKAPGDAYALRRDLDREAARVDKLLDFAIQTATKVPPPGFTPGMLQGPPGPAGPPGPMGLRGPAGRGFDEGLA